MLIIDERSLLSAETLSIMEEYARHTVHNGKSPTSIFGNLPAILLVGDDFQLPSVDPGALYTQDKKFKNTSKMSTRMGLKFFELFAKNTMFLGNTKPQHETQTYFKEIISRTRANEEDQQLTTEDAKFLCSYHLQNITTFSEAEAETIKKKEHFSFFLQMNQKTITTTKNLYNKQS